MNDSPFAHRITRIPKKTDAPKEERRTKPVVIIEPMPLTDDDLACEEEISPVTEATPVAAVSPAAAPAPAPRAMPEGLRQTLVAVAAFIATTLVLLLAVVVWKTVFGK